MKYRANVFFKALLLGFRHHGRIYGLYPKNKEEEEKGWWAREDSNLHGLPRCVLSAVRLPISPLARLMRVMRQESATNKFPDGNFSQPAPRSTRLAL